MPDTVTITSQCPACGVVSDAAEIDAVAGTVAFDACGHRCRMGESRLACAECRGLTSLSYCWKCGAQTKPRWEVAGMAPELLS